MVRSLWKAAVVVGLAWTGLAWAQSSPAQTGGTAAPERYMTVREEGGTPHRCKLLKTWREPNGSAAYEVQAVDSGEVMTILEAGQAASSTHGVRSLVTRIFHWGRGTQPPDDAPTAPANAQVFSAPIVSGTPPAPPKPWGTTPAGGSRFTPVTSPVSSPRTSSPLVSPPMPRADVPAAPPRTSSPSASVPDPLTPRTNSSSIMPPATAQKSTPTTASAPTLVYQSSSNSALTQQPAEPATLRVSSPNMPQTYTTYSPTTPFKPDTSAGSRPSSTTKTTSGSSAPLPTIVQGTNPTSTATTQPRLTPTPNGTCACQTPSNTCCQPSNVCCPPTQPRQSLVGRIFKPNPPATAVVTTTTTTTTAKPTLRTTTVSKPATESAQPRDWRESWGKVEPWKNTAQAKATPPKPDPATQPDPIKNPDWYRDMALQKSLPTKTTIQTTSIKPPTPTEKPVVVKTIPAMNPTTASMPPATTTIVTTPPVPTTIVTTTPPPQNTHGGPLEMRADESNAFWTRPAPAKPATPPQFNAFGPRDGGAPAAMGGAPAMMGGAPMGPMMGGAPMGPMPMAFQPPRPPSPPPMMDTGIPSGLANAFTVTSTRRPIPADFGPQQRVPNAFQDDQAELQDQGIASMPRPNMPSPVPGMAGYPHPPMPGMPMPGMPMMAPHGPVAGINPLMSVPPSPMPTPVVTAAPESVPQSLATLKDALCPSEREMAAEHLAELNWRTQPQVVESLMKAAREDPAASVRAACVHALTHMGANTAEVVAAMRDLKTDRDPHVRQEAEEALSSLGQDAGVRQASHSPR